VSLRIAFDLDGVFADMTGGLAKQAERLLDSDLRKDTRDPDSSGLQVPLRADALEGGITDAGSCRAASDRTLTLPPGLQRRLWRHLQTIENFWERLDETEPGALAQLAKVAREFRWEPIFLTSRPACAGASVQVQTQRWLDSKGFALPSVFVVQGSRGRIAAALGLDVVVDDTLANCLDVVAESPARAILIWRNESPPPASTERYRIAVVRTVGDCLEALTRMTPATGRGRVADRLRRFLGLQRLAKPNDPPSIG
jgi:hypothetical protein